MLGCCGNTNGQNQCCCQKKRSVILRDTSYEGDAAEIDVDGLLAFEVENYGTEPVTVNSHTTILTEQSRSFCNQSGLPYKGKVPIKWGSGAGTKKIVVQTWILHEEQV